MNDVDVQAWETSLVADSMADARRHGAVIRVAVPRDGWPPEYPFTLVGRLDDGSGDVLMVGLRVDWIDHESYQLWLRKDAPMKRYVSVLKRGWSC